MTGDVTLVSGQGTFRPSGQGAGKSQGITHNIGALQEPSHSLSASTRLLRCVGGCGVNCAITKEWEHVERIKLDIWILHTQLPQKMLSASLFMNSAGLCRPVKILLFFTFLHYIKENLIILKKWSPYSKINTIHEFYS